MIKEDIYGRDLDDFLFARGFKQELVGYSYIKTGIELLTDHPERYVKRFCDRLYPDIAEEVKAGSITANCVSRAIGYATDLSKNRKYLSLTPRGVLIALTMEWKKLTKSK